MNNRLEVYGTLGPACADSAVLESMFRAGMTGMRLNLSHSTLEESAPYITLMRKAAAACGVSPELLIDLQGPELRVGQEGLPRELQAGEIISLEMLSLPSALTEKLDSQMEILLDDGKLAVRVLNREMCQVLRGGILEPRKSAAVPGLEIPLPALTEQDLINLSQANKYGVTGIMQSFVRDRSDLEESRTALKNNGCEGLRLYAKVETLRAMQTLPQWMDLADCIVIARGDLGNTMPLWKLPGAQKCMEALLHQVDKPFMIVTQMLDSMRERPVPTRAEVNDVFNAVLDGASAIMLTGETAAGKYPAEAMTFFCNTAREATSFAAALTE